MKHTHIDIATSDPFTPDVDEKWKPTKIIYSYEEYIEKNKIDIPQKVTNTKRCVKFDNKNCDLHDSTVHPKKTRNIK